MDRASHYVWRLVVATAILWAYFGITNPMACALEGSGWNTECGPIRVDIFIVVPLAVWLAVSRAHRASAQEKSWRGTDD